MDKKRKIQPPRTGRKEKEASHCNLLPQVSVALDRQDRMEHSVYSVVISSYC